MRLLDQRRAQASARDWTTARWLQTILLVIVAITGEILFENQLVGQDFARLEHIGNEQDARRSRLAIPSATGSATPEQRALSTLLAASIPLDSPSIGAITSAIEEVGAAREAHDPTRLSAALQLLDEQEKQAREGVLLADQREGRKTGGQVWSSIHPHLRAVSGGFEIMFLVLSGAQIYLAVVTRRLLSPPLMLAAVLAMYTATSVGFLSAHGSIVVKLVLLVLALSAFGLWRRWREVS